MNQNLKITKMSKCSTMPVTDSKHKAKSARILRAPKVDQENSNKMYDKKVTTS